MRRKFEIRDLTEGALMSALSMILILLTLYVPGFYFIGLLVSCVPLACLAMRRGTAVSVVALIVCYIFCIVITHSILMALELTLISVMPGFAVGLCYRKKCGFFTALALTCGSVICGMVLSLFILNQVTGGDGVKQMLEEAVNMFEQIFQKAIYSASTSYNADQADRVMESINNVISEVKKSIMLYFPSVLIICSLIIGYIQAAISAFVINRTRSGNAEFLEFSKLKAPKSMCYFTAILFIIVWLQSKDTTFGAIAANANLILMFIIGVCGLSLIDHKVSQKIPAGGYRVLIYVAAVFVSGFLIGIILDGMVFIGMFDGLIDIRKLGKVSENNGEEE